MHLVKAVAVALSLTSAAVALTIPQTQDVALLPRADAATAPVAATAEPPPVAKGTKKLGRFGKGSLWSKKKTALPDKKGQGKLDASKTDVIKATGKNASKPPPVPSGEAGAKAEAAKTT
ncbi:hypothetical protein AA313_de0202990 [Arthrobotrys entomopaga]|nr:hypothetical protein AA313_de0202990 [Arthrobotrys entomopaga]